MKNLWIIVLNWNRPSLTIECLQSLQNINSTKFNTKILIVDNGSDDNSVKLFRAHLQSKRFKPLKNITAEIIETGVNHGFAGGNNYGIRYALERKADYLILLNNDTTVDKNFAKEMLEVLIESEDVGFVCPKIYFSHGFEFKNYDKSDVGKVIWSVGGEFDWANVYGSNRGVDQVDHGQFDQIAEVDFASGACFATTKEVLKKCGLLDENYFMYLEDVDLSHRVKMSNYKILYSPKAVVWHKVSQSSSIGGNLNDYFITRNRLLFGFRYASMRTKLALSRESIKYLIRGRKWQRKGVWDYYRKNLGKGSWI